MHALATLALLLSSSIPVDGQGHCPAPAQVETLLRAESLPGVRAERYRARLVEGDGTLMVTLVDETSAAEVARKALDSPSCEVRAEVARAVIAAWLLDLSTPPPAPPPTPRSPLTPPSAVASSAPPPASPPLLGGGVAVGGVGASVEGLGLSAEAYVRLRWASWPVAARASLKGQATRATRLGAGRVEWERLALGAGVELPLLNREVSVLALLELGGAALRLRAVGFDTNRSLTTFDAHATLGMRVELSTSVVRPFVQAQLLGWLEGRTVRIDGVAETTALPHFEGVLALGAAFGAL